MYAADVLRRHDGVVALDLRTDNDTLNTPCCHEEA